MGDIFFSLLGNTLERPPLHIESYESDAAHLALVDRLLDRLCVQRHLIA